eukprot:4964159-Amphidinium_carterae.1
MGRSGQRRANRPSVLFAAVFSPDSPDSSPAASSAHFLACQAMPKVGCCSTSIPNLHIASPTVAHPPLAIRTIATHRALQLCQLACCAAYEAATAASQHATI